MPTLAPGAVGALEESRRSKKQSFTRSKLSQFSPPERIEEVLDLETGLGGPTHWLLLALAGTGWHL